jgi:hypothetical protein
MPRHKRKIYLTGGVREALKIPGFRSWLASQRAVISPTVRKFDPRLRLGSGLRNGKPHGYLGRQVLDLGDRHAHAIVDVPWKSLEVNLKKLGRGVRARFDPWKWAIKGRSELLAIRNPRPTDGGDKAIIEVAVHVNRRVYNNLRASGEFDVLPDGILARRGRKKKATNIFVVQP